MTAKTEQFNALVMEKIRAAVETIEDVETRLEDVQPEWKAANEKKAGLLNSIREKASDAEDSYGAQCSEWPNDVEHEITSLTQALNTASNEFDVVDRKKRSLSKRVNRAKSALQETCLQSVNDPDGEMFQNLVAAAEGNPLWMSVGLTDLGVDDADATHLGCETIGEFVNKLKRREFVAAIDEGDITQANVDFVENLVRAFVDRRDPKALPKKGKGAAPASKPSKSKDESSNAAPEQATSESEDRAFDDTDDLASAVPAKLCRGVSKMLEAMGDADLHTVRDLREFVNAHGYAFKERITGMGPASAKALTAWCEENGILPQATRQYPSGSDAHEYPEGTDGVIKCDLWAFRSLLHAYEDGQIIAEGVERIDALEQLEELRGALRSMGIERDVETPIAFIDAMTDGADSESGYLNQAILNVRQDDWVRHPAGFPLSDKLLDGILDYIAVLTNNNGTIVVYDALDDFRERVEHFEALLGDTGLAAIANRPKDDRDPRDASAKKMREFAAKKAG